MKTRRVCSGVNGYSYVGDVSRSDPSGLLSCEKHMEITKAAALMAHYSNAEANALAQAVCDVDHGTLWKKDSAHTHQHAMMGRKSPNGPFESCQQAYDGTKDLVRQMTEQGKTANALHAIQDAWPDGHYGYQPWDGPLSWLLGTDPETHYQGDYYPSQDVENAAIDLSWYYLNDLRNNYFTSPT